MKCLQCKEELKINENKKRAKRKKFCNNSCSATYNNLIRYSKIELCDTDLKTCYLCKIEKEVSKFYKRKGSVDGYRNDCKDCLNKRVINQPNRKESKSKYYQLNKEAVLAKSKEYSIKNKESIKESKKAYQSNNKTKRNKYLNTKYKTDSIYKLSVNCRCIILKAFKRSKWKKNSKTQILLGCSYSELKSYLESLFKEGMNWENHGKWHIDHKIPLSWAKNEEELINLCHYKNLQPLWASENMSKKNYYSS